MRNVYLFLAAVVLIALAVVITRYDMKRFEPKPQIGTGATVIAPANPTPTVTPSPIVSPTPTTTPKVK